MFPGTFTKGVLLLCSGCLATIQDPVQEYNVHDLLIMYGVSQLVECWTQDPKIRGLNPVRSTRIICEFFQVKNVVLTRCWCAQPLCVYMHTQE